MNRTDPRVLAEAVASTWYSYPSSSNRIDVPLGTVAALSLIRVDDPDGPDLAAQWAELDAGRLRQVLRRIWELAWLCDPYLVEVARPLHDWLDEDLASGLWSAVHSVVETAFRCGILGITGWADPAERAEVDLLSALLTELRAPGARQARGEHHTPAEICETISAMLLGFEDIPPAGTTFTEPTAGTGGMVRAAAQHLRALGASPADYMWVMTEIDPYAAASCAVNAIVWGLGPNVLVHCGDTLAEGNGPEQAAQKREAVLAHRDRILSHIKVLAGIRAAEQLLSGDAMHRKSA